MPENLAALKSQILSSLSSKSDKAALTNPPELPTAGRPWQGPRSTRRRWPGRRRGCQQSNRNTNLVDDVLSKARALWAVGERLQGQTQLVEHGPAGWEGRSLVYRQFQDLQVWM